MDKYADICHVYFLLGFNGGYFVWTQRLLEVIYKQTATF